MSDIRKEFYAAKGEHVDIEAIMRFQSVKRWHMIDTTRQQTLAEHSANVAALVWAISISAPGAYFATVDAAIGALFHDISESFTGDVPSPTKKYLKGLDEIEWAATPPEYTRACRVGLNEDILIKMCDLADGIRFIRHYGVGITARHAAEGLETKLRKIAADLKAQRSWPDEVIAHVTELLEFYINEKA